MNVTRAIRSAALAIGAAMVIQAEARRAALLGECRQLLPPANETRNDLLFASRTDVRSDGRPSWV